MGLILAAAFLEIQDQSKVICNRVLIPSGWDPNRGTLQTLRIPLNNGLLSGGDDDRKMWSQSAEPTDGLEIRFSVPMFVAVPMTNALAFDVGTAYSMARVEQTASGPCSSIIPSSPAIRTSRITCFSTNAFTATTAGAWARRIKPAGRVW